MSLPELSAEQRTRSGLLDLRLGPREGRTRLIKSLTRSPLQVQRVLYLDEQLPDMAFVTIANPSAGLLAGDDHTVRIRINPGARVHVGTQAATKVFTMAAGGAQQTIACSVEDHGLLEYLPEPLIPFHNARFAQDVKIDVSDTATLIYGDILASGRVAHEESFGYTEIQSRLSVQRPSGEPLYYEAFALDPRQFDLQTQGVFGVNGATAVATLIALSPGADMSALVTLITSRRVAIPTSVLGAAPLPSGNGIIVKILAESSSDARATLRSIWSLTRPAIVGANAPADRRH